MAITKKQAIEQMPEDKAKQLELLQSHIDSKLLSGTRTFTASELQDASGYEFHWFGFSTLLASIYTDWEVYAAGNGYSTWIVFK